MTQLSGRPVKVFSTGAFMPERVFTNDEFSPRIDTSDEWIRQRTGITERRFAADDETLSDMAAKAGKQALERAGWTPQDVDFLLMGTCTPEALLPNTAQYVHSKLGLEERAGAVDMINACSSFSYALTFASGLIGSGLHNKILVLGGEKLSAFLNFDDRGSCILFGDGAGAACVGVNEVEGDESRILGCRMGARFDDYCLSIPAGGSRMPASRATVDEKKHFVHMNGRATYKFAVNALATESQRVVEECGYTMADVKCIVPHQVNIRIIESSMEKIGFPIDRVFVNLHKYGNTSAGSVPVALHEAEAAGMFTRGDLIVLVAFGGGLAWGAQLIRW
jgi:3-oxoacyl-[acyl-carrier-protein] synthase-3